jgi:hypothetical protein
MAKKQGKYRRAPPVLCETSQIKSAHQPAVLRIKTTYLHQVAIIASISDLMQNRAMRTTITLDDEAHEFAAYYARSRGLTLSAAINELIRKVEAGPEPAPDIRIGPNGLPLLPKTGRTITSEMVKRLSEDDIG